MLSNNELMLFHGTNQLFYEVDLEKSKNKRDFGKGFYTTTLELQNTESVLWAESSEFIVDELFREWENK
ncbi:hypothetical protein CDLVIII_2388 [Clostridium sp. DL-VIII]|uniref:DUF3990 domain-containing protein n=1 Tax=Clostridium sp. DL-VIII TaxID=641107 RepID=UPI00023AFE79|nr:DUF3990 domain-containing protein [Clostridium sp. DL-VIII]EHI99040.1 hypothetical protein CDLVIII_2388 [Clostridium sp. DL-VIII]